MVDGWCHLHLWILVETEGISTTEVLSVWGEVGGSQILGKRQWKTKMEVLWLLWPLTGSGPAGWERRVCSWQLQLLWLKGGVCALWRWRYFCRFCIKFDFPVVISFWESWHSLHNSSSWGEDDGNQILVCLWLQDTHRQDGSRRAGGKSARLWRIWSPEMSDLTNKVMNFIIVQPI